LVVTETADQDGTNNKAQECRDGKCFQARVEGHLVSDLVVGIVIYALTIPSLF
jgi:hypothetical protein